MNEATKFTITGETATCATCATYPNPADWLPIETAPKDGTDVLIADATHFTRARWAYYEHPAMTSLGYGDPATGVPEGGMPKHSGHQWWTKQVPNPKAGERLYRWHQDNPVAFDERDKECPDHDGNFDCITPTHWMTPPPKPPAIRKGE